MAQYAANLINRLLAGKDNRCCAARSSWFGGLGRQPHTAACRARFAGFLKDDAKFKNAEARKRELEEKMLEKAEKAKRKNDEEAKHETVEMQGRKTV